MALKSKKLEDVRASVPVEEVQKQPLVRVNLNVPESVREYWKMAAIKRKTSVGDLIVTAMNEHLSK